MIKGCAKRVVVVRNIDSSLFEEAFFIVKSGQSAKKSTEEEFLGEAERLVKTTPNVEHAAGVTENSPPNRQESGSSAFSDSQTDFSSRRTFSLFTQKGDLFRRQRFYAVHEPAKPKRRKKPSASRCACVSRRFCNGVFRYGYMVLFA